MQILFVLFILSVLYKIGLAFWEKLYFIVFKYLIGGGLIGDANTVLTRDKCS